MYIKAKNSNNPRSINKIVFVLVFFGILFTLICSEIYLSKNSYSRIHLATLVQCRLAGGKIQPCQGPSGLCGCFKEFTDAGKTCTNSNDCSANACITEQRRKVNKNDKGLPDTDAATYLGACPQKQFIDFNHTGDSMPYVPICGEATIEEGKIVEDRRLCVY